jgi:hypothetical protein
MPQFLALGDDRIYVCDPCKSTSMPEGPGRGMLSVVSHGTCSLLSTNLLGARKLSVLKSALEDLSLQEFLAKNKETEVRQSDRCNDKFIPIDITINSSALCIKHVCM